MIPCLLFNVRFCGLGVLTMWVDCSGSSTGYLFRAVFFSPAFFIYLDSGEQMSKEKGHLSY